jgi:hypothetical protein
MGKFEPVDDVTFMNLVNVELDRYSSPVFDFCWDVYTELGKSAPIVEIAMSETARWNFGNIDKTSLLSYNDIDASTLRHSDLKSDQ